MTTIAKLSNGTLLKVSISSVYTTVPEVMRISGPGARFDLVDVTSHDSGLFREYLAGLADGDVIRAEANLRTSNVVHQFLRDANINATLISVKIVFPDTTQNTCTFAAYVQEYSPEANVGEQIKGRFSFKMTGAPVWT